MPDRENKITLRRFIKIALACPGDVDSPEFVQSAPFLELRPYNAANRHYHADWDLLAKRLKLEIAQLRRFLQILVLAEREFQWIGGSVASGITLCRYLFNRDSANEENLRAWISEHSRNDWMPLTRAEEKEREARHRARRAEVERQQAQQQAEAAERRRLHHEEAELHRLASIARNEERSALLENLSELSLQERIRFLLNDWNLSLDAFPPDLLSDKREDYRKVSIEELDKLRNLIGGRKRQWRPVARTINELCRNQ